MSLRHRLPLSAFLAAGLLASGCGRKLAFTPAHAYVVRGQVVQLPEKGKPFTDFYVAHEAIPDFYDAEDMKVGMPMMTMPFVCTDPDLLAPLRVGDKIRMTVVVSKGVRDWDITALEKLPPETELKIAR